LGKIDVAPFLLALKAELMGMVPSKKELHGIVALCGMDDDCEMTNNLCDAILDKIKAAINKLCEE